KGLRDDPNEQQRDKIQQHHEIEAPQPPCLKKEYLAAHNSRQNTHPEGKQPPVEEIESAQRNRGDRRDLRRGQAMFAPHEWLPKDEKPEVHEHRTARPEILRAPHRGKMQRHQHDEKQPSPRPRDEQLGNLERGSRRHTLSHLRSGSAEGSALKGLGCMYPSLGLWVEASWGL